MALESGKSKDKHEHAQDDSSIDSFEKDLAATIVPEHAQQVDIVAERRILRKIDLYLIPWMWIGYGFVYYDKVRLNDISSCETQC